MLLLRFLRTSLVYSCSIKNMKLVWEEAELTDNIGVEVDMWSNVSVWVDFESRPTSDHFRASSLFLLLEKSSTKPSIIIDRLLDPPLQDGGRPCWLTTDAETDDINIKEISNLMDVLGHHRCLETSVDSSLSSRCHTSFRSLIRRPSTAEICRRYQHAYRRCSRRLSGVAFSLVCCDVTECIRIHSGIIA